MALNMSELDITPIETAKKHYTFKANDLDPASKHILEFHVFVPENVTVEDILDPAAWVHIAQKLQPMCHIHVTAEDNSFCALLRVLSCGQLWAKTSLIWHTDLTVSVDDKKELSPLSVKFISNRYKWGVLRLSDRVWISKEHSTEADAIQSMSNELRSMRVG